MPELKCTVQTCMHNQDFLCRLDSIQAGRWFSGKGFKGDLL